MPFLRIEPEKKTLPTELLQAMTKELERGYGLDNSPSPADAPQITEEITPIGILHVTVVWDAWASLSVETRSQLILDAYKQVVSESQARLISIALGLTHAEARLLSLP